MTVINHYKNIINTPAQLFALEAYVELLRKGLTDGTTSAPNFEDSAITISLDNKIVGVLTWSKAEWCKTIFVRLGHVSPEYRGKGYYKILWQELLKKAIEDDVSLIDGATNINNIAMREVAKKQGRIEYGVMLRYFVKRESHG